MRPRTCVMCLPASSLALLWCLAGFADDWPTFRGPNRTAVSTETNLLQEWPTDGPPLLWTSEGTGRGYTSLAIKNGRMYFVGDNLADVPDTDEYLVCCSIADGKRLWTRKLGAPWNEGNPNWQGPRSTPSVDDEHVYALSATGELACCKVEDGAEQWRKNLQSDLGGSKADKWGYSESVLLDGDRLICTPGGDANTMVALDQQTGEKIWSVGREGDTGAGHASIVISQVNGAKVYVQTTGAGALGVRDDGVLMWSYPIERTTAVAPTPIIRDDLVFFAAGYKRGGALLRQVPGDDGTVGIEEVYPLKVELANKHGGIVLVGDYLYGDSDDAGIPFCAEFMTGEIKWKDRGTGKGSIAVAAADGHLYMHYADGTMVLANADSAAYSEVGVFKVPHSGERPSWAHPVILDGRLYLREHNAILCYDIRNQKAVAGGQ